MSNYFYIVSRLNGLVLDVEGQKEDGGPIVTWPAHGGPTQLWKWDSDCRLVNKGGLFMEVKDACKHAGTRVISAVAHQNLHQKWHVQEGSIMSNLSNLVLDINGENTKKGAEIEMSEANGQRWVIVPEGIGEEEEGTEIEMSEANSSDGQTWVIIPEDAWEEFKFVQANPNPLSTAQFWKNMGDNYLHIIVGCTIDNYDKCIKKCITTINDCAETLNKVGYDVGITQTVGGGAVIAGGGMALAGLLLAPFLGGISLGLTVGGAVTTAAGATASVGGSIVNNSWETSEQKKIQDAVAPAIRATMSLQSFLKEYLNLLCEAVKFLKTEEGKNFAKQAFEITKMAEEEGQVAWNTYKLGNVIVSRTQQIEQAKAAKAMVDFIQADWYALHGTNLGLAVNVAAPGFSIPLFGRTIIAAGTTSAKMLSGVVAMVGVAFGIWDVMEGTRKINNGSEMAAEFKTTAESLQDESEKLIQLYKELKK